jgi:hypothetical protein
MVLTPQGSRLVVGSWGSRYPEIHVFARGGPEPLLTVDAPGSVFDVDIVSATGGKTYVAACGKHVHAGQSGRGGDLYAIEIPADATGLAEPEPVALCSRLGPCYPNPFNPQSLIRYELKPDQIRADPDWSGAPGDLGPRRPPDHHSC